MHVWLRTKGCEWWAGLRDVIQGHWRACKCRWQQAYACMATYKRLRVVGRAARCGPDCRLWDTHMYFGADTYMQMYT